MKERCTLDVTLELRSDTIFGSGYSIPGGEDIAVAVTEKGFPYLKGSTLKGLLRESLENLLVWTGGTEQDLTELLGASDWNGETEYRRVRVTDMKLLDPPKEPSACFAERTFTSLEGGVVKQGTLRTASCIRRGLRFAGEVECAISDKDTVQATLRGISQAGTMRNRGFGSVRIESRVQNAGPAGKRDGTDEETEKPRPVKNAVCVRYRLHTELPVMAVDAAASSEFTSETRGYLPGAALRGAVINRLASDRDTFEQRKAELLRDVRFLDAMPVLPAEGAVIPSLRGFYEAKGAETEISSVFLEDVAGKKRAKLGSFCVLNGDTISFGSARTGGVTRIDRGRAEGEKKMYQVRALNAGQDFEGYILLDDPGMSEWVTSALCTDVWLGADRYAGYGRCSVTGLTEAEQPGWVRDYGFHAEPKEAALYLLAVSPFAMLDEYGNACGIHEGRLAELLGVGSVTVEAASTAMSEFHAYNRTWQSRSPKVRMYDRGSLFRLACDRPPKLEAIRETERNGLGIRTPEGFGQVLFLSRERIDGITKKCKLDGKAKPVLTGEIAVRNAKYRWVMEHAAEFRQLCMDSGPSGSQIGTLQSLCEQAIALGGDTTKLNAFFEKNINDRGVKHGSRFMALQDMVNSILLKPLSETLRVEPEKDDTVERLALLCMLFDHSRKLGKEDAE